MNGIKFLWKEFRYLLFSNNSALASDEDIRWARAQLRRVSYKRSIFKLHHSIDKSTHGEIRLRTTINVPHRDGGPNIDVEGKRNITYPVIKRDWEYIRDLCYDQTDRILMHELDEVFHFDDVRIYDPHKG